MSPNVPEPRFPILLYKLIRDDIHLQYLLCTVHFVQLTINSKLCVVYSVQSTVWSVQCAIYSVKCTVCNV